MCIACVTGLIAAGSSLSAAKGATAWVDRRRWRGSRTVKAALLLSAVLGAATVPVAAGDGPGADADGHGAQICLAQSP